MKYSTTQIVNLITIGNFEEAMTNAIHLFQQDDNNRELLKEMLTIKSSHNRIEKSKRINAIEQSEYDTHYNKNVYSVFQILEEYEKRNIALHNTDLEPYVETVSKIDIKVLNSLLYNLLKEKGVNLNKIDKLPVEWVREHNKLLGSIQNNNEIDYKQMIFKYLNIFDFEKAEESLLADIKSQEDKVINIADRYFELGKLKNLTGHHLESLEYIEKASILNSNNTEFLNDLGLQYLFFGQYNKAKEKFEDALEKDQSRDAYKDIRVSIRKSNIANSDIYLGNYEQSINNAKEVIDNLKHSHIDIIRKKELEIISYNTIGQSLVLLLFDYQFNMCIFAITSKCNKKDELYQNKNRKTV